MTLSHRRAGSQPLPPSSIRAAAKQVAHRPGCGQVPPGRAAQNRLDGGRRQAGQPDDARHWHPPRRETAHVVLDVGHPRRHGHHDRRGAAGGGVAAR